MPQVKYNDCLSKDELSCFPQDLHNVMREASKQWSELYWLTTVSDRILFYGPQFGNCSAPETLNSIPSV